MSIRTAIRSGLRELNAASARRELRRLPVSPDFLPARIVRAVDCTLDDQLDDGENAWRQKIEARRETLGRDQTTIRFTDYGTGKPDSDRSAGEMHAGQTVSSTVVLDPSLTDKAVHAVPLSCR